MLLFFLRSNNSVFADKPFRTEGLIGQQPRNHTSNTLPRAVFLAYGSGPMVAAVRRITREANATGAFSVVHAFTNTDIDTKFASAHADVLQQKRGGGYWLWKPYFVARVLAGLAEGELLFYADAGCEFKGNPTPYLLLAHQHGFLGFHQPPHMTMHVWTKGDIFSAVGLNSSVFGPKPQVIAGIFALRKSQLSTAFVSYWLRLCTDLQLISDAPSVEPNHASFEESRHDMSIFSALFYKLKPGIAIPDETWPYENAPIIGASRRRNDRRLQTLLYK